MAMLRIELLTSTTPSNPDPHSAVALAQARRIFERLKRNDFRSPHLAGLTEHSAGLPNCLFDRRVVFRNPMPRRAPGPLLPSKIISLASEHKTKKRILGYPGCITNFQLGGWDHLESQAAKHHPKRRPHGRPDRRSRSRPRNAMIAIPQMAEGIWANRCCCPTVGATGWPWPWRLE